MQLKKIIVENFKHIEKVEINDVDKINVLVGGNNAGKSSFLQAVHFSVTAQSTRSRHGGRETFSILNTPYMPCGEFEKIRYGAPYSNTTKKGNSSTLSLEYEDGANSLHYKIEIRKGRNEDNMTCKSSGDQRIGQLVSSQSKPYSIFVPGLAGLPISERFSSQAVVLKGLASGECNLYLRNILLLLHEKKRLDKLNKYVGEFFPGSTIVVEFDKEKDEFIHAYQKTDTMKVPIEFSGTGFIQIVQIYSYVILYEPKILLLDEPDSHLHPDNQKKLCDSLISLCDDFSTTVFLATHSKHMISQLYGNANFLRLQNGCVQEFGKDIGRLPMLVDLGALDEYDKLNSGRVKYIFLTEDSDTSFLKLLLTENGFVENEFMIVSYKTCSNFSNTIMLISFFKEISANSKIVVHRDRDFMEDEECAPREKEVVDNGGIPFITQYSDIEAYFCNSKHISHLLGVAEADVVSWINDIFQVNRTEIIVSFTHKRGEIPKDIKSKKLHTTNLIDEYEKTDLMKLVKGKFLLRKIRGALHERWKQNCEVVASSPFIQNIDVLQKIRAESEKASS